ncbi:MAG: recombination protein O N-terminal domain-containing protein [Flavobacteriales bacterium]|nr:recombination protein O N-terminal domain-containing protein [Flavobacteriales bacterium]
MLQTTRAVVLRTFKHGDNFVILKAYTECFGVRSYIVRISKRGSAKPAHLQPLDRLEIVVSESGERELHTVREVRTEKAYVGIAGDPARGLLLLFAQEVFYRTLKEESPDPELFRILSSARLRRSMQGQPRPTSTVAPSAPGPALGLSSRTARAG